MHSEIVRQHLRYFRLDDRNAEPKSRAEHLEGLILFDDADSVGFLNFTLLVSFEWTYFDQHVVCQVHRNGFPRFFLNQAGFVPESNLFFNLEAEGPKDYLAELDLFLVLGNIIDLQESSSN